MRNMFSPNETAAARVSFSHTQYLVQKVTVVLFHLHDVRNNGNPYMLLAHFDIPMLATRSQVRHVLVRCRTIVYNRILLLICSMPV